MLKSGIRGNQRLQHHHLHLHPVLPQYVSRFCIYVKAVISEMNVYLFITFTSASVVWTPSILNNVTSWEISTLPSLLRSKRLKASLISSICSSVNWSATLAMAHCNRGQDLVCLVTYNITPFTNSPDLPLPWLHQLELPHSQAQLRPRIVNNCWVLQWVTQTTFSV